MERAYLAMSTLAVGAFVLGMYKTKPQQESVRVDNGLEIVLGRNDADVAPILTPRYVPAQYPSQSASDDADTGDTGDTGDLYQQPTLADVLSLPQVQAYNHPADASLRGDFIDFSLACVAGDDYESIAATAYKKMDDNDCERQDWECMYSDDGVPFPQVVGLAYCPNYQDDSAQLEIEDIQVGDGENIIIIDAGEDIGLDWDAVFEEPAEAGI